MLLDEAAVQREFGNLLEIPDNYPKYVVTMDEMQSGGNYQGIKQISLRNFLLAEDKEKLWFLEKDIQKIKEYSLFQKEGEPLSAPSK